MSKNKNKAKKELLYTKYGKVCMFTGVRTLLTYHHIDKAEWGGATTEENGAVLSRPSQDWLHNYIEHSDPSLFDLANECLLLYKKVMDLGDLELIKEYRDTVMPEYIARIPSVCGPHKKLVRRR